MSGNIINKVGQKFRDKIRSYVVCTAGAIAVVFAVLAPVLVGSTGMALDLAQSYNVRQRLCSSLDASALAAAASSADEAEIVARVTDFFDANYPEDALGFTYDLSAVVDADDVIVSAHARYDTSFMRVLGIDEMVIYCETIVHREVRGLEVVLVLDNTGSMSTNNNIGALRDATTSFVNILFDATSNPEFVKMGLVPYANSVRIGNYGLGLNPDGSPRGNPEAFVTLPPEVNYTTDHNSGEGWYGCVVAHHSQNYDPNADHVIDPENSYGQLWESGGILDGHGWNATLSNNDPYPTDVEDDYTGPWDIYMSGDVQEERVCVETYTDWRGRTRCRRYEGTGDYEWRLDRVPNYGCPYAYVMPLTSDRDSLLSRVDDMLAHGHTLGNVGMIWGRRLISPEAPFDEGAAWDDPKWRKAIIMMTDGNNTRHSQYSYFGDAQKNQINVTDYNERFVETCEALKAQNVLIYTVTFYSNISDTTKGYYRSCATSEDQYYDAPSQDDLISVFEKISRELSQIHIRS